VNLSGPKRQRVALNKQVLPVEGGIMTTLKKTALHALHVELGAKMVEFAGYDAKRQACLMCLIWGNASSLRMTAHLKRLLKR